MNGGLLVRFDLATGKVASEFRSPVVAGTQIEWCGPNHLLINNQSLIDLNRQWEVWRYEGGMSVLGSPDSRHWTLLEPYASEPAYLAAIPLPEKGLERIVKLVADKKAPALLRTGNPVSLKFEFSTAPSDAEGFRRAIAEQFTAQMSANDIKVEDGQPVTLVVKVNEIDTGESQELRMLFPATPEGENAKKSIPIKILEYEISFVDATGKAVYEPKQIITYRELGAVTIPKGEKDPAAYLRNQLWLVAKTRILSVGFPPFLARGPDGVVRFPGFSNFAQLVK
jgi:hypothetical protein